MGQRAYCHQDHPAGDAEADRHCESYHRVDLPRPTATAVPFHTILALMRKGQAHGQRLGQAMFNALPPDMVERIIRNREAGWVGADPYEIDDMPSLTRWVERWLEFDATGRFVTGIV